MIVSSSTTREIVTVISVIYQFSILFEFVSHSMRFDRSVSRASHNITSYKPPGVKQERRAI